MKPSTRIRQICAIIQLSEKLTRRTGGLWFAPGNIAPTAKDSEIYKLVELGLVRVLGTDRAFLTDRGKAVKPPKAMQPKKPKPMNAGDVAIAEIIKRGGKLTRGGGMVWDVTSDGREIYNTTIWHLINKGRLKITNLGFDSNGYGVREVEVVK